MFNKQDPYSENLEFVDPDNVIGKLHVSPGHYYSPIPSNQDFQRAIKGSSTRGLENLDLPVNVNKSNQLVLAQEFANMHGEIVQWLNSDDCAFDASNTWFFGSDAICAVAMIRKLLPAQIIEIGCGHSSVLIHEANKRWLGDAASITLVDPNAQRLKQLMPNVDVLEVSVQDVPLTMFDLLNAGDILMIDSSHVLKAGSDVWFLLGQVLPRLPSGVVVHIHDVFFPFEYPDSWLSKSVAFNEAYAVQLLLQGSDQFQIKYWNDFIEKTQRTWVVNNMPACLSTTYATGGIWLEKK